MIKKEEKEEIMIKNNKQCKSFLNQNSNASCDCSPAPCCPPAPCCKCPSPCCGCPPSPCCGCSPCCNPCCCCCQPCRCPHPTTFIPTGCSCKPFCPWGTVVRTEPEFECDHDFVKRPCMGDSSWTTPICCPPCISPYCNPEVYPFCTPRNPPLDETICDTCSIPVCTTVFNSLVVDPCDYKLPMNPPKPSHKTCFKKPRKKTPEIQIRIKKLPRPRVICPCFYPVHFPCPVCSPYDMPCCPEGLQVRPIPFELPFCSYARKPDIVKNHCDIKDKIIKKLLGEEKVKEDFSDGNEQNNARNNYNVNRFRSSLIQARNSLGGSAMLFSEPQLYQNDSNDYCIDDYVQHSFKSLRGCKFNLIEPSDSKGSQTSNQSNNNNENNNENIYCTKQPRQTMREMNGPPEKCFYSCPHHMAPHNHMYQIQPHPSYMYQQPYPHLIPINPQSIQNHPNQPFYPGYIHPYHAFYDQNMLQPDTNNVGSYANDESIINVNTNAPAGILAKSSKEQPVTPSSKQSENEASSTKQSKGQESSRNCADYFVEERPYFDERKYKGSFDPPNIGLLEHADELDLPETEEDPCSPCVSCHPVYKWASYRQRELSFYQKTNKFCCGSKVCNNVGRFDKPLRNSICFSADVIRVPQCENCDFERYQGVCPYDCDGSPEPKVCPEQEKS